MAESLTTEHAYLSVRSFPVVVLTEAGVLSDGERTSVMEHLEGLLDEGGRQIIVIDVSEGALLPESQRLYLADAIAMRSKQIAEVWAGVAIVAGAAIDGPAKAAFWLEVFPVEAKMFQTLEPAVAWARTSLGLPVNSIPAAAPADAAARASRLSEPRARPRAPTPLEPGSSKSAAPAAKGKASDRTGFLGWLLGPRGLVVMGAVFVAIVLLFLSPPPEDHLSSSDAATFAKRKAEFAMRVLRQPAAGREVRMKDGEKCVVGDKLAIEMDIPAAGYTMMFGQKGNGPLQAIWPTDRAGQLHSGLNLRPPRTYKVEEATAKETFFVAYCAERFRADDCKLSGGTLKCPESCVTKAFSVTK